MNNMSDILWRINHYIKSKFVNILRNKLTFRYLWFIVVFSIDNHNKCELSYQELLSPEQKIIEQKKIAILEQKFSDHIFFLTQKEKRIEKENLLYHINIEQNRINVSAKKTAITVSLSLAFIPYCIRWLTDSIANSNLSNAYWLIYSSLCFLLIDIFWLLYKGISVSTVLKSRFSDLKNAENKSNKIIVQYYYDWQQLKRKADYAVGIVSELQKRILYFLLISLMAITLSLIKYL